MYMRKIAFRILIVISILIIGFGIFAGSNIEKEIVNNASASQAAVGEISSVFMRIVILIYSLIVVSCIWIIYGVMALIISTIKKRKNRLIKS